MKRLGPILDRTLKDNDLGSVALMSKLRAGWADIVGAPLARVTSPVKLRGSTLIVIVRDSIWQEPVIMQKGAILEKIRSAEFYGRSARGTVIDDIYFMLSRKMGGTKFLNDGGAVLIDDSEPSAAKNAKRQKTAPKLTASESAFVESVLDSAGENTDPEIKETLARLIGHGLDAEKKRARAKAKSGKGKDIDKKFRPGGAG